LIKALDKIGPTDFLIVRRPSTSASDVNNLNGLLTQGQLHVFDPLWLTKPFALRRLLRAAFGLVTFTPIWIVGRYSRGLAHHLRGADGRYDRIIAIGEASAIYVRTNDGPWHWDKARVLQVSTMNQHLTGGAFRRGKLLFDRFASRRYESSVGRRMSSVTVTSREEKSRWLGIVDHWGTAHDVAVLPSGVPAAPQVSLQDAHRIIVWLGSFGYDANVNGLRTFISAAEEAFISSGATLRLLGGHCPPQLQAEFADKPWIDFRGYVPQLADVLDGVTAAVVPVWEGAGIKMKTLTLLAHGVPVITTTSGAEGVPEEAFVRITDDVDELVATCLATQPFDDWTAQAKRGREVWLQHFSHEVFGATAEQIFDSH
jgi:glycosyltransferase involved in cell wall biosynthesis